MEEIDNALNTMVGGMYIYEKDLKDSKIERYSKLLEYFKSINNKDIYNELNNVCKVENIILNNNVLSSIELIYPTITLNIELDNYSGWQCRILIRVKSNYKFSYDEKASDEYVDEYFENFKNCFNHSIIHILEILKDSNNRELDNVIRFDMGTGIGKDSNNINYDNIQKKFLSNGHVSKVSNTFNNGYYYVNFYRGAENIDRLNLHSLNKREGEDELQGYDFNIKYNNYKELSTFISHDNLYFKKFLEVIKKIIDLYGDRVVLDTRNDIDGYLTIKSLKLSKTDFNILEPIINNPKDFHQKEINKAIFKNKKSSKNHMTLKGFGIREIYKYNTGEYQSYNYNGYYNNFIGLKN